MKPRLLDLFCGAGGAAMGYHRAGFEVVGVDIKPQPHYSFEFHQADALEFLMALRGGSGVASHHGRRHISDFDAIHASPPCQAYSKAQRLRSNDHPDLMAPVRALLQWSGLPYIIENVPGAPLVNPVRLCGTSWNLGADGFELRRHRLFESNVLLFGAGCQHELPPMQVFGHGDNADYRKRYGRSPDIVAKRKAMGIDWMNRDELSEAIPPAYTEFIGLQLMQVVDPIRAAAARVLYEYGPAIKELGAA